MNMKTLAKHTLLAAMIAGSASALAAPAENAVGTTSHATSNLSLTVPGMVQIVGVDDITFGTFNGTDDVIGSTQFCVFRNGGGNYNLTVSASDNVFDVNSGTDSVAFSVLVDDDTDASVGGSAASDSVAVTGLVDDTAANCSASGDNASMQVTFAAADLLAAPSTTYTETLTLTVAPE